MSRILLFIAALAALGAAAFGLGALIDPDRGEAPAADHAAEPSSEHAENSAHADEGGHAPRGLAASVDGLRLALDHEHFEPGRRGTLSLRVLDADDRPVTDFERGHARLMHLIVVRRDLTGYQHLHPRPTGGGAWETPLELPEAGTYRVFADFIHDGRPYTLGTDLQVPGGYEPRDLPAPSRSSASGPYRVALAEDSEGLRFEVTRGGRPVELEPYLGARGHLVAVRDGDLAYLHVHPRDDTPAGRGVRFAVEYPSGGRYRLFLQFRHEGRVRLATFTKEVGDGHGH